jgi:hypothetical protein
MWGGVPDGEIESDEDYDDEEMEDGYVEGEEEFDEDGKFYLFIYFKILRRRVEINILLLLSYLQRMICLMLLQCMYTICTLVALKMAHKSSVKRAHNLLPLQPPLLPLSNLPLLHLLLSLLLLLQVVVLTLELLLLALLQQLLETTLILLSISMAAYSNPLLPSSKPSVLL